MGSAHTQGRRIKAAAELGGYRSLDQLAREVNLPKLSPKSLRRSANDARDTPEHELRAIAEACGLPYEFFTVDFSRLPEIGGPAAGAGERPDELQALRSRIQAIDARLEALPMLTKRLAELEREVRQPSTETRGPTPATQHGRQS